MLLVDLWQLETFSVMTLAQGLNPRHVCVWTVIATGLFSTNRRCRIEDIQTINVKEKLFYRGKLPDIQSAVFYHRLTFNTTNVLLCEACFGHIRAQCELDTQNHCHLLILLDRTFYETELTPNHCG